MCVCTYVWPPPRRADVDVNVASAAPMVPANVTFLSPPAGATAAHLLMASWLEAFRGLPAAFGSGTRRQFMGVHFTGWLASSLAPT